MSDMFSDPLGSDPLAGGGVELAPIGVQVPTGYPGESLAPNNGYSAPTLGFSASMPWKNSTGSVLMAHSNSLS